MRSILVHRAAYNIFKGDIPLGKFVCYSCDNRACCNPDHLWIGNHKDNARDALKKYRLFLKGLTYQLKKGCKSPAAKLESYLAESYCGIPQAIYSIKYGKTWKGDYGWL